MTARRCLVLLTCLLLGACTAVKQEPEEITIDTPLEVDPTEPVALARWWSNGRQMLQLYVVGSYELYDGINRHDQPVERGRWSQPSYAWLRFEPYVTPSVEPVRVQIIRVDGEPALVLPDLEPMRAIDGPPPAPEDRLIGTWSSSVATLSIADDHRYLLVPADVTGGDVVSVGRHAGSWKLVEDRLQLRPDSPRIDPRELIVHEDAKGVVWLESPDGDFSRAR